MWWDTKDNKSNDWGLITNKISWDSDWIPCKVSGHTVDDAEHHRLIGLQGSSICTKHPYYTLSVEYLEGLFLHVRLAVPQYSKSYMRQQAFLHEAAGLWSTERGLLQYIHGLGSHGKIKINGLHWNLAQKVSNSYTMKAKHIYPSRRSAQWLNASRKLFFLHRNKCSK